jgi:flagellar protein FlaG
VGAEVALSPVTSVVGYREPTTIAVAPVAVTDIPVPESTSQAAKIPAAHDPQKTDAATARTSRVIIDPQTNAVVYQSLDASTGAIVDQVPSQSLLRQRVYADAQAVQALIKGKSFSEAVVAAAQEVDTTT